MHLNNEMKDLLKSYQYNDARHNLISILFNIILEDNDYTNTRLSKGKIKEIMVACKDGADAILSDPKVKTKSKCDNPCDINQLCNDGVCKDFKKGDTLGKDVLINTDDGQITICNEAIHPNKTKLENDDRCNYTVPCKTPIPSQEFLSFFALTNDKSINNCETYQFIQTKPETETETETEK